MLLCSHYCIHLGPRTGPESKYVHGKYVWNEGRKEGREEGRKEGRKEEGRQAGNVGGLAGCFQKK